MEPLACRSGDAEQLLWLEAPFLGPALTPFIRPGDTEGAELRGIGRRRRAGADFRSPEEIIEAQRVAEARRIREAEEAAFDAALEASARQPEEETPKTAEDIKKAEEAQKKRDEEAAKNRADILEWTRRSATALEAQVASEEAFF